MLWHRPACCSVGEQDRMPSHRPRCKPEHACALQKKKMRTKVADEDGLDLAALEAEAAAAAGSSRDRGSREERAAARDAAEREGLAAADEQRKAR